MPVVVSLFIIGVRSDYILGKHLFILKLSDFFFLEKQSFEILLDKLSRGKTFKDLKRYNISRHNFQ